MRTTKQLINEMSKSQEPSRQEIAKDLAQGLKPRMVSAKVGKHELIIFGGAMCVQPYAVVTTKE